MTVKLEDYVAGGYFVVIHAEQGRDYPPSTLLPLRLLSASESISRHLPDNWSMDWSMSDEDRRRSLAIQLGASLETVKQIAAWVGEKWESNELEWMDVFTSVGLARAFLQKFFPSSTELMILGAGLHKETVHEFLAYGREHNAQMIHSGITRQPWHEGEGAFGIYDVIVHQQQLESGGTPLGFELLGYYTGSFTSWLTHSLVDEMFRELKIRPNAVGLIETLKDAQRCATYVAPAGKVEEGSGGVEPGWWAPWLVVQYPVMA